MSAPLWRQVTEQGSLYERTDKLRVPGGWLYRTQFYHPTTGVTVATSMVFQPERSE
jgi:hypothetical protein